METVTVASLELIGIASAVALYSLVTLIKPLFEVLINRIRRSPQKVKITIKARDGTIINEFEVANIKSVNIGEEKIKQIVKSLEEVNNGENENFSKK